MWKVTCHSCTGQHATFLVIRHTLHSPSNEQQTIRVDCTGVYQRASRRCQWGKKAQLCRDHWATNRSQELRPPARQTLFGHCKVRPLFSFLSPDRTKSSVYRLPNVPRPRMSICILADAADIDRAKQIELEYMSVDDLKKYVCDLIWICSTFLSQNTGWIRTKNWLRNWLKNMTLSLPPRPSSNKFPVSLDQVFPKVDIISIVLLAAFSHQNLIYFQLANSLPRSPTVKTSPTNSPKFVPPSSFN